MENYTITQERKILVRPRRLPSLWAEKLTGISNQSLEQASSLDEAMNRRRKRMAPSCSLAGTVPFHFCRAPVSGVGGSSPSPAFCWIAWAAAGLLPEAENGSVFGKASAA